MKSHLTPVILVTLLLLPSSVSAQWAETASRSSYPTHFDRRLEPGYQVGLAYIEGSRFEGHGESSVTEMDANWAFAYFSDVLGGDIDGSLIFDAKFFSSSADLDLPDQVAVLALGLGWTWHYADKFSLQTRFEPGFYTDIEEFGSDAIYYPFSLALAHGFTPVLDGVVGLTIRPDFERVVMPIIGVNWEISNLVHLMAQLPESRLEYFATANWNIYAGFNWENTSYALRKQGDFDREQITIEDLRFFGGLGYRINDELQVALEVGEIFDRDVEFDRVAEGMPTDVEIEDAFLLRVAIIGPF